ncbi:hypothetical protein KCP69_15580 [Salmonella enterica subsp. enterica]|nr:hypothetical protein KCP69_15580 [Salmonella enterica subsp. enterica]
MTIEQAKTLHDGARFSLRGSLIDHKKAATIAVYVFHKLREINVIICFTVFDGREVQPDQMINIINGSLDESEGPLVRVCEPTAK